MYDVRQTDPFREGYRIYFTIRGTRLILLLAGGDKGSQRRDIVLARSMIERLGEDA